jgi:RNA polymerase sigma factor (sigma-70 family)
MTESIKATQANRAEAVEDPLPELRSTSHEPGSTVASLFKAQARRVSKFLTWRLRNEADAQDATQEAFLRLWRREKDGTLRADAGGYLGSAVQSAAIDVDRWRSYRRNYLSLEEVDLQSSDAEPGEALFWQDALRHFVVTLNDLPDLTQRIFVLYHVEGHTHTAISQRLGVTVRTVERHMARAIAHCEERMKDYL